MSTHTRPFPATVVALALVSASGIAQADPPSSTDDKRFVSVGGQADSQHDRQALATLSLPVNDHVWVQAGAGQSHERQASGDRTIVNGGIGVASSSAQVTLEAAHRAAGSSYRQTDIGTSLDWKHGGHVLGVDVTHRDFRAAGVVTSGSGTVPAQVRVAGTGLGVHGTLQATERASVYGAFARNHYRSTTTASSTDPAGSGGLLGLGSVPGTTSVVNRDEAALSHSVLVGAAYRFDKVATAVEVATGPLVDGQGTLRSVELKAGIDVAPGWRVSPGIGRGTNGQAGTATFGSVTLTHGW